MSVSKLKKPPKDCDKGSTADDDDCFKIVINSKISELEKLFFRTKIISKLEQNRVSFGR